MELFLLRVFQRQVLDQCEYIQLAAQDLIAGLDAQSLDRTFFAIQNLLTASANVSKLLWGQKGRRAQERRALRESIGVDDDSPLRLVSMRNHFEHIDERIDRWWSLSPRRIHADKVVAPRGHIVGLEEIDTFRYFEPEEGDVIFWGEQFSIYAVLTEVQRILPKLREEVAKPHE